MKFFLHRSFTQVREQERHKHVAGKLATTKVRKDQQDQQGKRQRK